MSRHEQNQDGTIPTKHVRYPERYKSCVLGGDQSLTKLLVSAWSQVALL